MWCSQRTALVRGIEGFSAEKVLESCGEYFQIETLADKSEIAPRMKNAYDAGQKAFAFVYKNGDRMNYALLILKDAAVMEEFMPEKSEASRGLGRQRFAHAHFGSRPRD